MKDVIGRLYDARITYSSIGELNDDLAVATKATGEAAREVAASLNLSEGTVVGVAEGARLACRALGELALHEQPPTLDNILCLLQQAEAESNNDLVAGSWFLLHKLRGGGRLLHKRAKERLDE